jgi:hypothetical protein
MEKVQEEFSKGEQLIVVDGFVHDVRGFIDEHPAGSAIVKPYLGKVRSYPPSVLQKKTTLTCLVFRTRRLHSTAWCTTTRTLRATSLTPCASASWWRRRRASKRPNRTTLSSLLSSLLFLLRSARQHQIHLDNKQLCVSWCELIFLLSSRSPFHLSPFFKVMACAVQLQRLQLNNGTLRLLHLNLPFGLGVFVARSKSWWHHPTSGRGGHLGRGFCRRRIPQKPKCTLQAVGSKGAHFANEPRMTVSTLTDE